MRPITFLRVLILSVFIVVIFPCTLFAEVCNRVVAIVNDEVITLYELNKKIREITGLEPEDLKSRDESKYLEARRSILELLINDKITQEKIRELEIKVTPKEVDGTIERLKEANQWTQEDLMSSLKKGGLTYEKYRDTVKEEIERAKLINYEVKSKIIIREEELRQYYEDHKAQFSSEEKLHLAGIFLMRKNPEDEKELRELRLKADDILARLKNGEKFGDLARKFSQGPGADDGGDLGEFKPEQLDPKLKEIIEKIPEGGVSDLIVRPNGIQIIKLVKNQKKEIKPFEEVKDAIYVVLYREEVNRKYVAWINELRKNSYTKIIF